MTKAADEALAAGRNEPDVPELELSDADILDAMEHIPGYLDITTEDFRTVYHLAHRHAVERLFGRILAPDALPSLAPQMTLDEAAKILEQSGHKAMPVHDAQGRLCGLLLRKDFLAAFIRDELS